MDKDHKVKEIEHWLKTAPGGSRLCYYEGQLAVDREVCELDGSGGFHLSKQQPQDTIGTILWDAYCKGKVLLTQERTGRGNYRYWAHKRSTR